MSTTTKIEWTDSTWNFVRGCTRVSDGCLRCYIDRTPPFRMAHNRFDSPSIGGKTRVTLHPEKLTDPLHWRAPRRVFVNSLSDLFHKDVPDELIARAFGVMARTPQHSYQILTKRAGRMHYLLGNDGQTMLEATRDEETADALYSAGWPLKNVWMGVSVEDQRAADLRINKLLDTPAAVRFLSCEPLLGPVDLSWASGVDCLRPDWCGGPGSGTGAPHPLIDWVIGGGESGPGARPMDLAWAHSLVKQCADAEVPMFMKQLGSVWAKTNGAEDRKGGNPDEWPAELRVRQYPRAVTE